MMRRYVSFDSPYRVSTRNEPVPMPGPDQVTVKTSVSAISSGTELLFYRGQVPVDMAVDANIESLGGQMRYPLRYGYAAAGQVIAAGAGVDPAWNGARVFSFQPHQSHFVARTDELIRLPDKIRPEHAVFLPNLETAVNFVMDGQPTIGENVVILGQGVVGLLTTALLSRMPLACLAAVDYFPLRRRLSALLGAQRAIDPGAGSPSAAIAALIEDASGADLVFELTGNPAALNLAIDAAGFGSRIVIGSWYGQKRADVDLGGLFHRNRIQIISSQVSTIDPRWSGRWDKARRMRTVMRLLESIPVEALITHRFPVDQAAEAYALLDQHPDQALQVLITYD